MSNEKRKLTFNHPNPGGKGGGDVYRVLVIREWLKDLGQQVANDKPQVFLAALNLVSQEWGRTRKSPPDPSKLVSEIQKLLKYAEEDLVVRNNP